MLPSCWTLTCFLALLPVFSVIDAVTVELGHSATVLCHLNCSTVQWWSKATGHEATKVFEFSEGKCTVAPEFKDRIECSKEKIRDGDVSFTISSVVYNDRGWYYCSCDGKDQCDKKIEVLVPTSKNFSVGSKAGLPCYAETDKRAADSSAYVLWEKDEQQVMKLENGKMSYGAGFEQRAAVSVESYRKGDLSLTIDQVRFSDAGLYRCLLKDGEYGHPDSVTLVVEAHQYSHHIKEGDSTSLDLAVPSPVMVYFRDSWMCTRPKDDVHCKPGYEQRTSIVNNSLMLSELAVADSGTYTVMDVKSGEVVAVHKLSVIGFPSARIPVIAASVPCAVFLALLGALLWACLRKKRKQPERGKEDDVTEPQEKLLHLSIQQSQSNIRSPLPWNEMKEMTNL